MAIETFKPLGLVSAIILIVGLSLVVRYWPQGMSKTFSQHVASSKRGILYYTLLFTVVLSILLVFFIGWFVPYFGLSAWFTFFLVFSAATQYLCTLVPETGGKKSQLHRMLAGASAVALLPVMAILARSNNISAAARAITLASLVVMIWIVATIAYRKAEHKYFLILQSLYFLAFFVAVLSATYIR